MQYKHTDTLGVAASTAQWGRGDVGPTAKVTSRLPGDDQLVI